MEVKAIETKNLLGLKAIATKAEALIAEHPNATIGVVTENPYLVKKLSNNEKLRVVHYHDFITAFADYWLVDDVSKFLIANNIYWTLEEE